MDSQAGHHEAWISWEEPTITVYALVRDEDEALFRDLVQEIGRTGFGKRKSVGYGAMREVSIESFDGLALPELRHTHASLPLQQGVHPKVVSERLGHANIQTTLDTYSHLLPGMQEDAIRRFDEALGQPLAARIG